MFGAGITLDGRNRQVFFDRTGGRDPDAFRGRRRRSYCHQHTTVVVWHAPPVDDCVFCQIISGKTEASLVLERPTVVAFLDQRPVFKGHVLLVPREHVVTLPDLPAEQRDGFLAAGQDLATAVTVALGAEGSFVAINNTVSQSVPHLHLHVVPRTKGDGLRGFFWPRTKYAAGEMDEYAARLRDALED